jgi:hypothetical protein
MKTIDGGAWPAFQHAWTAAVGTPEYDKAAWMAAEEQLLAAGIKPQTIRAGCTIYIPAVLVSCDQDRRLRYRGVPIVRCDTLAPEVACVIVGQRGRTTNWKRTADQPVTEADLVGALDSATRSSPDPDRPAVAILMSAAGIRDFIDNVASVVLDTQQLFEAEATYGLSARCRTCGSSRP